MLLVTNPMPWFLRRWLACLLLVSARLLASSEACFCFARASAPAEAVGGALPELGMMSCYECVGLDSRWWSGLVRIEIRATVLWVPVSGDEGPWPGGWIIGR